MRFILKAYIHCNSKTTEQTDFQDKENKKSTTEQQQ